MRNIDHELMTSQVMGYTPPDEATKHKCRLQICANASSTQEAEELMQMLGVYPGQNEWYAEELDPVYSIETTRSLLAEGA